MNITGEIIDVNYFNKEIRGDSEIEIASADNTLAPSSFAPKKAIMCKRTLTDSEITLDS